jgi:chemotaxis response regulator CheB
MEEAMRVIRVLVANQPRLMRELVLATISDQTDIEIVGQVDNDAAVRAAVESTAPDFLIVALTPPTSSPSSSRSCWSPIRG